MSAESAILVFISNILKQSYQDDAFSEIEKMISHNSLPIVITNDGDNRYDNFSLDFETISEGSTNLSVPIIKLPKVGQQYSFPLNVLIVEKFIKELLRVSNKENIDLAKQIALRPPTKELLIENIW